MESIDKVHGTFEKKMGEQKATVPPAVIKRLPRYHRYLGDLLREGKGRISSAELSRIMGVTASQIYNMTGLEIHIVHNWVKRNFLTSPVKKLYSAEQFASIIIINMMRESVQIERISKMLDFTKTPGDKEGISTVSLYCLFVDTLCKLEGNSEPEAVKSEVQKAIAGFLGEGSAKARALEIMLRAMVYAYSSARMKELAKESLLSLE